MLPLVRPGWSACAAVLVVLPVGCQSASGPECPPEAPPTGLACEGELRCDYGASTECEGGARITHEHVCHDGAWMRITHGACNALCPLAPPTIGARCDVEPTCSYGERASCTEGSLVYSYVCEGGYWTVSSSGSCNPDPCPQVAPTLGSACTGPMYCDYDEVAECIDEGTLRHLRACREGVWYGAWTGECQTNCAGAYQGGPCHGWGECYSYHDDCPMNIVEYWLVCDGGVWRQEARGSCRENPCHATPLAEGEPCSEVTQCASDLRMECVDGSWVAYVYTCDGVAWSGAWQGVCETKCPAAAPEVETPCLGDLSCYYDEHRACDSPATEGVFRWFVCDGAAWRDEWRGDCSGTCPDTPPEAFSLCAPPGLDCSYGQHIACPGINGGTELHHVCEDWSWTQEWQGTCSDAGVSDGGDDAPG